MNGVGDADAGPRRRRPRAADRADPDVRDDADGRRRARAWPARSSWCCRGDMWHGRLARVWSMRKHGRDARATRQQHGLPEQLAADDPDLPADASARSLVLLAKGRDAVRWTALATTIVTFVAVAAAVRHVRLERAAAATATSTATAAAASCRWSQQAELDPRVQHRVPGRHRRPLVPAGHPHHLHLPAVAASRPGTSRR